MADYILYILYLTHVYTHTHTHTHTHCIVSEHLGAVSSSGLQTAWHQIPALPLVQ